MALKHYLRVTDTDFERAAGGAAESGALVAKVVQKAVQHSAAGLGTEVQETRENAEICGIVRDEVATCTQLQNSLMTPTGLEPVLPP